MNKLANFDRTIEMATAGFNHALFEEMMRVSDNERKNGTRIARWRHRALLATGRYPDGNVSIWQFLTGSFQSTELACMKCGRNHHRHGSSCYNCEDEQ